mmetsp:Transcript_64066/g.153033  ORF Transcript_64066/g.153033 Transcript_64066/m.153033 type:complete len:288 (-) Transcript_64066:352-1215(-)
MHGAGRRDAQSHCWVQLSSRHGTDGEAAHRDARADGQCKVEAVLCLGIAARRGNSGAAEYDVGQQHSCGKLCKTGLSQREALTWGQADVCVGLRPCSMENRVDEAGCRASEILRRSISDAFQAAAQLPAAGHHCHSYSRVEVSAGDVAQAVDHAHQSCSSRPGSGRRAVHEVQAHSQHEHEDTQELTEQLHENRWFIALQLWALQGLFRSEQPEDGCSEASSQELEEGPKEAHANPCAVAGDVKADGHSWVESCARHTADSIASGDDGPGDGKSVEVIAIFAGIVSL